MKSTMIVLFALMSTQAFAAATVEAGAEILIGQCAAMAGPASGLGTEMHRGLKASIDAVNARGGVHGRKIRLESGDDGYEPEKAVECTGKMIEQTKVFALAGYVGTPTGKVAAPMVQELKVPLIGLFTGAMIFREPVQRYVINIRASYDDETEALVNHMTTKLGAKKIAVFYQNDSFGQAGLSGTEKALARRKMPLVSKGTFERNTIAVQSGLAAVMQGEPDAVVMVGPYKPIAEFVRQAQKVDLKATLATISFVGTDSLLQDLGSAGNGLLISQVVPSPDHTNIPLVKEYLADLAKAEAGAKPSYVSFEGYVTGRFLIAALEKAGKELNREALIDTIEGVSGLDLGGMKLSFSATNHQGSTVVFLTKVENGKAVQFQ